MSENSEFMTKINRMPIGTVLERERYGKHGSPRWKGVIKTNSQSDNIGPVRSPDLGTVMEHLLILYKRGQNEDK